MVWKVETSNGCEATKTKWRLVPYTRGRVLDIGCGPDKAFPHFIGVDNGHHSKFGYKIRPDIWANADKIDLVANESCDAVFSSHLLEHIPYEHVADVLSEWWRCIKVGGYLCLYLPDEDEYPPVGHEHANPDHKWNVNYGKVLSQMKEVGSWDLVEFEKCNKDDEYSLFFSFKKLESGKNKYSYQNPKPDKTCAVVRYGAFGDLMMASSVLAGLKKQGYHTTLYTSPPGSDVITHDPNIDQIILQEKDQVPNQALGEFWEFLAKRYDKFVNLSESVEGTFLALPGRAQHAWPHDVRHRMLNYNYVQFQHELAGVPHEPKVRFYPTEEERQWAERERAKMLGRVVMWSLIGSSVHKRNPHVDAIVARFMLTMPDVHVILVGGPEAEMLEAGWENEKRVIKTCGKWSIRQTLSMVEKCDLIIGGETGVLNAASCLEVPKILFLSHSSAENLSRDWVNTISLEPDKKEVPCFSCHQLHYGWTFCKKDEDSGTAMCQVRITPDMIWRAVEQSMTKARVAA